MTVASLLQVWKCPRKSRSVCYSRMFVRQFLCVNYAYANSYVRNAIHKTLLRTKNRKFVLKYAHDLSCRTTENFRKDSELMNLPRWLVLESQGNRHYASCQCCDVLRHCLRFLVSQWFAEHLMLMVQLNNGRSLLYSHVMFLGDFSDDNDWSNVVL